MYKLETMINEVSYKVELGACSAEPIVIRVNNVDNSAIVFEDMALLLKACLIYQVYDIRADIQKGVIIPLVKATYDNDIQKIIETLKKRLHETVNPRIAEGKFQRMYHDYQTYDEAEAKAEAEKVNQMADGFEVEAVGVPGEGWCLMLKRAAAFAREIGVIPDDG